MKKIISYEKDILFKTKIGEICSISLEHDFTVDDGFLKGEFILEGDYKPNGLSLNRESFNYHLPLEYELEKNADVGTLSYDIDNFEYTVEDDCLSVYIDFGIRYDEIKIEPNIPEITEEDLNKDIEEEIEVQERSEEAPEEYEEIKEKEDTKKEKLEEIDFDIVLEDGVLPTSDEVRLEKEEEDMIVESTLETDEFITYHVHIVREGDTLDSIANKYGCTIDLIKEYNNVETLEIKSKLIIPDIKDE